MNINLNPSVNFFDLFMPTWKVWTCIYLVCKADRSSRWLAGHLVLGSVTLWSVISDEDSQNFRVETENIV
jgi:hypothetical protein